MVKHLPSTQETNVNPWVGKTPGEGYGNPLQHSCLGNSMDRGAQWAAQSMGLQRAGHDWATSTIRTRISTEQVKNAQAAEAGWGQTRRLRTEGLRARTACNCFRLNRGGCRPGQSCLYVATGEDVENVSQAVSIPVTDNTGHSTRDVCQTFSSPSI